MAGQDQAIPQDTDPLNTVQISPLVPQPAAPEPAGNVVVAANDQPRPSQGSGAVSAPLPNASADAGAGLLQDILKSKSDAIVATKTAMEANNSIDNASALSMSKLYDSTMASYDNLKKIERWQPTGLPSILGLFDSDWNQKYQSINMQSNQVSAQQIADRATTMKNINNQVPALLKLSGDMATEAFNVYKDQRQLNQQDQDITLRSIQTKIQMEQEGRTEVVNAVDRLSLQQKQAALAQAQQGKGQFVGAEGLLTDGIHKEQSAELSLAQLRTAVQSGNDDLASKELDRFTSYLPVSQLQPAVDNAIKNNQAVISMPTDKKGNMIHIPLPVAQKALAANLQQETQLRTQVATQYATDNQIPQKINEVTATAAALSLADPRAGHELTIIGNQLKGLDYKDMNSVRMGGEALSASQARLKQIADDVSKTYQTPEAQQAIKNYAATGGNFTDQGGKAVVADTVGNYGATNTMRYKAAMDVVNQQVAAKIAAKQSGGMQFRSSGNGTTPGNLDQTTIMALLSQNKAAIKDSDIVNQVLGDPTTNAQVIAQIKNTVKPQALITVIQSLAADKGASPIWATLLQNPANMSANGAIDQRTLSQFLERQSVSTGYKVNYNNALLARMQKYGSRADEMAAHDPSYTIADRALETSVFGAKPQSSIVGDLYNEMKVLGQSAHAEMQQRIQSDVSGQTAREASQQNTPASQGLAFNDLPSSFPAATPKAGIPSATGLPLTDADIRSLFQGGK